MRIALILTLMTTIATAQDRLQFSIAGIGGSEQFAPYVRTASADPIVEYGTTIVSLDAAYVYGRFGLRAGLDAIQTDTYETTGETSVAANKWSGGAHLQAEWYVSAMFAPFIGVSAMQSIDLDYRQNVGWYRQYDLVENCTAKAIPGIGGYIGAVVYRDGPWSIFVRLTTREWSVRFPAYTDRCQSLGLHFGTEYRF